ncbi:serine/threonine protein kinase [Haliangium ochraceum]|uniref:Serine/threonine protein kinase n=1 Tax=Haliangium ochraceum (strain DSM 14365 / JCM 11303 / SMP-2) TaxID=502025 RepID=D0LGZ5_HALO1|nr:serine/threonine-protein kinase [Haliangium ochraceum]ACY14717.1 serine/threonine protein kinase [Haliangium ochraceum DSM 14365]
MARVMPGGGIRFGNYQLVERLAHGGMAEVYLARQQGPEGFDRRVAIKRILPHLAGSENFLRMFLDEARLAASLSHPNVVHIYELGKEGEHYYLAMEFIDGVHAGAIIDVGSQHRLPVTLVARIGADACAGLNSVHNAVDSSGRALHLVHRDISPPNLMISYDGVVKLMDFGIAKAVGQVEQTRPGIVKGKFAYMSPEQTTGETLDGRSDVFSLSLVLWELLAGYVALPRTDPVEAMTMIRDGKIPPLAQARPDLPPQLTEVVSQGLTTNREHRPSAAELGNALEGFIKSSPELGTPMQLSEWVRRHLPRHALHSGGDALADGPRTDAEDQAAASRDSDTDVSHRASYPDLRAGANAGEPADAAAGEITDTATSQPAQPLEPIDPATSFLEDSDEDDGPTVVTSSPRPGGDALIDLPPPRPSLPANLAPPVVERLSDTRATTRDPAPAFLSHAPASSDPAQPAGVGQGAAQRAPTAAQAAPRRSLAQLFVIAVLVTAVLLGATAWILIFT